MDFQDNDNNTQELMNIFQTESEEILERIFDSLTTLEKDPGNKDLTAALYRDMHSIKGAIRMVGFSNIQTIVHKIEDIFDAVNTKGILLGKDVITMITKALELVGPKVVRDTLKSVVPSPQAYVCITGVLGGVNNLDNFSPIAEIPNQVYLTSFLSNTPTQKNINEMFDFINDKKLTPLIGKIFEFENIRDALIAQENGKVNGKIIVNISN